MFPFWTENSLLPLFELIAAVTACVIWMLGGMGGRPAAR